MNLIIRGIKKLGKYGIILIGFNLFIGCSSPYEPYKPTFYPVEFELDAGLPLDENGYYHLTIDDTKWQTLHRISGHVYMDGNPVNVVKFAWGSNLFWEIGDTLGYIHSYGYTDDLVYVGYDTSYVTWFDGDEVPIVNGASYSNSDGEVNTMIAPVKTMVGDTCVVYYAYADSYYGIEYDGEFYVIFD